MDAIPFVDAHMHLWDLSHLRYPWLTPPFADDGPNGSVEAIATDFDVGAYRRMLKDWNLVGAVHVDAGADPSHALDETAWLEQQAQAEGLPTAIVAFAALDQPDIADLLRMQSRTERVRGIRHIVNWHPDPRRSYTPRDLTCEDSWAAGYAALAAHALSFDLQCYPGQADALVPLIARHPDIPVAINHLGMPVLTDADGAAIWRSAMRSLARIDHVAVKLSGLGFIDPRWTTAQVRPFILEAIELFGPKRCMLASDAPTDSLFAPPERYLETYREVLDALSEDERCDVWGRTANRFYRLDLPI
jgi:predicted TIM-barrel fold metal-dependent hydrolase